jgi:hypothetical protein
MATERVQLRKHHKGNAEGALQGVQLFLTVEAAHRYNRGSSHT